MDLPRPLSPITPPLPEDPLHPMLGLPYGARLLPNCLGFSPLLTPSVLGYSPSLPPNGLCYSHSVLPSILGYSPSLPPSGMGYSPSLPTSRCNTPLQFEVALYLLSCSFTFRAFTRPLYPKGLHLLKETAIYCILSLCTLLYIKIRIETVSSIHNPSQVNDVMSTLPC